VPDASTKFLYDLARVRVVAAASQGAEVGQVNALTIIASPLSGNAFPPDTMRMDVTVVPGVPTADVGPPPPGFWIQAVPNAFSHTVSFRMRLPVAGRATLALYDLQGRKLATILDHHMEAGVYGGDMGSGHDHHHGSTAGVTWDQRDDRGRSVANGMYFYRLTLDQWATGGSVPVIR
jgi:hypothetical protein